MSKYKTEQEKFWAGKFGDDYSGRNFGQKQIESNAVFFSDVLKKVDNIQSIVEFGANIGLNLRALRKLLPDSSLSAIEINKNAVRELKEIDDVEIFCQSILDFWQEKEWDLVLIKGVLIHINPDVLGDVYNILYKSSSRYICIAEYYNTSPVEVTYRGHKDRLFKRDFAGEMLDKYDNLELLDYGFKYHRDPFPQDDITWFLLEKSSK